MSVLCICNSVLLLGWSFVHLCGRLCEAGEGCGVLYPLQTYLLTTKGPPPNPCHMLLPGGILCLQAPTLLVFLPLVQLSS